MCLALFSTRWHQSIISADNISKPASPDLAKELAALTSDIIQAVTSELTRALTAEFHSISRDYHSKLQTELQEMKSELLRDNASLRAELGSVVRTVSEVETSLSALSDEVVVLRARVESLSSELVRVDAKCEDLERGKESGQGESSLQHNQK
uniref:Uncharacterized protein n=1 Tax=Pygocentrus nattereri TaxID=42514 RepID=A0AAR2LXD0_PYGNA